MSEILERQCRYVRGTREILFLFLEEIPVQKLHESVPSIGHGSILRTHIHVIDCYRRWLGNIENEVGWMEEPLSVTPLFLLWAGMFKKEVVL